LIHQSRRTKQAREFDTHTPRARRFPPGTIS
jgi:hypothetical protein